MVAAEGSVVDVVTAATPEKPLLRGWLHQCAAFTALGAGLMLASVAPTTRAMLAALGFTASFVLLFGVSATYHRVTWSPAARAWMRRADHASIFVLIAGTYTPIAIAVLPPSLGQTLLAVAWGGALVGVVQSLFFIHAPKWVVAAIAVAVGWSVVPFWSEARAALHDREMGLIFAGGVAYTLGAVAYALKRPVLSPRVFGYHEVFHAFTLVGATLHFIAITWMVQRAP
jgi:hemolysin III